MMKGGGIYVEGYYGGGAWGCNDNVLGVLKFTNYIKFLTTKIILIPLLINIDTF